MTQEKVNRAIVSISGEMFQDLITQGNKFENFECLMGIPAGATFMRMDYDIARGCYTFLYEHPSFSSVAPGSRLPELEIAFKVERK